MRFVTNAHQTSLPIKNLIKVTLEKDAESEYPFLPVDVAVVVRVEAFEDPVQQNVVRHIESVVQELSESGPVQPVDLYALGQLPVERQQSLHFRLGEVRFSRQGVHQLALLLPQDGPKLCHVWRRVKWYLQIFDRLLTRGKGQKIIVKKIVLSRSFLLLEMTCPDFFQGIFTHEDDIWI